MSCQFATFKATFSVVVVVLMLAPSPALQAPAAQLVHRRQIQQTPSNTSLDAINGLTVSLIYTETQSGFSSSSSGGDGEQSNVADSMCDLLAYHDLLSTPPAPEMEETGTTTTSDNNSTEDLLALLRLNVEDTCAWLRLMGQETDGSTTGLQMSPTSCDLHHLRLFCVTRRLAAVELSVSQALLASIYETYNEGAPMPISMRPCDWINRKVPEMKPQLDNFFFC